jgi:hypothetical protein
VVVDGPLCSALEHWGLKNHPPHRHRHRRHDHRRRPAATRRGDEGYASARCPPPRFKLCSAAHLAPSPHSQPIMLSRILPLSTLILSSLPRRLVGLVPRAAGSVLPDIRVAARTRAAGRQAVSQSISLSVWQAGRQAGRVKVARPTSAWDVSCDGPASQR